MTWFKCENQNIRTSAAYGVRPEYFGFGNIDGGFWQGKLGDEWVIVKHENYGVHFAMDGFLLLLRAGESDYWTDANNSWFLYEWSSRWCLSQIYGRTTWESTATYPVYVAYGLPTASSPATFSCTVDGVTATKTLTRHFPHWTSSVPFGQYTSTGGAAGTKLFGSPRWRQTVDTDFPKYFYRAANAEPVPPPAEFLPNDTSAGPFEKLTYSETDTAWIYGPAPSGEGTFWKTDDEPSAESAFTLAEYTRASDGQGGYDDTATGSTLTYTADGYGQCPTDKTKILLVTPEILT